MIQILGLRSYFNQRKQKEEVTDNTFWPQKWSAPSVKDLFANHEKYLEQIPEKNRWNMYFTAFNAGEHKRQFKSQDVMPFDIDWIDVERIDDTIAAFCRVVDIPRTEMGICFTGHGLQLFIGLTIPFNGLDFFEKYRDQYRGLCSKIDRELLAAGLPGKADDSVFSAARLLRLPGTINRKRDKKTGEPLPDAKAYLISGNIVAFNFDLVERSGIPYVEADAALSQEEMKKYPRPDSAEILSGCSFLKFTKENPDEITEPQWYAALSVLGRLDTDGTLAHEYSRGYSGYSASETTEKLAQSMRASGPRTCRDIDFRWGGCHNCKHFEKVKSPICIRGEDYIATQDTGFHQEVENAAGKIVTRPVYEDLRRYFNKKNAYRMMGGSRMCYTWDGKVYKEYGPAYIEAFANDHFNPQSNKKMREEFRSLVEITNLTQPEWWADTTLKKINFQNGVLDMETLELIPHSTERGFRYILSYDYEPGAGAPVFQKFLDDITQGDKALQNVLLEYCGYALSSDANWHHSALVLLGEGSNGKSTFMNVLRSLAGQDNYTSLTFTDLKGEFSRQLLDGKLFNIAEETPTRSLMDSSLFKNLVAGGETQVRSPYKKPYVMRNRAKLIFAANKLPDTVDTSEGFFRRFLIVPFRARFSRLAGNLDPFIEKRLGEELPGIFNLAMAAYRRMLKAQDFSVSDAVHQEVQSYRLDSDTVLQWAEHALEIEPAEGGAFAVSSEIYAAYCQEMERLNLEPANGIVFGKRLAKIVPEYTSRATVQWVNGKSARVVKGVRLKAVAMF